VVEISPKRVLSCVMIKLEATLKEYESPRAVQVISKLCACSLAQLDDFNNELQKMLDQLKIA
jgi:hypothetical protein